jgi:hypothetical protein
VDSAVVVAAGQVVMAVILRVVEGGRPGETEEEAVLRWSWCMKAAMASSVNGRLAGTQLEGGERGGSELPLAARREGKS